MFVALGWLATNIALAYLFIGILDVRGLALASTIAFTLQSLALYILNYHRLGYLFGRELLLSAGRALLGALGMALIIFIIKVFVDGTLIFLIVGGAAGLVAYFAITYLTGAREIPALIRLIRV
jgi:peptidoglycan biosynthesis protein MviN/MurJ (putative lipid II flippase)